MAPGPLSSPPDVESRSCICAGEAEAAHQAGGCSSSFLREVTGKNTEIVCRVSRTVFIADKLGRPDILGPLQILAVDTNRICSPAPEMGQQKIPRYSPQPGTPERHVVRVRGRGTLKRCEESILRQILGGGCVGAKVTQVPVNGGLVFIYKHCQRFTIQVQASLPQQPVLLQGCAAMKKGCKKILLI